MKVWTKAGEALAAAGALAAATPLAFSLRHGLLLLKSAVPEYQEAIRDGKIVNAVAYQDARGFVQEADVVFSGAMTAFEARDAQAAGDVKRALEALKQAFPTVTPPAAPVKSPGAVMGLSSLVELAVSPHTGN